MDQGELQDLLLQVITTYGPDLAGIASEAAGQGGGDGAGVAQLLSKLG